MVAELLLAKGADVNQSQENDATPLCFSAQMSHQSIAELRLSRGAAVDQADSTTQHGHLSFARLLLSRGAAIVQAGLLGFTPLSVAVMGGHLSYADFLISNGADISRDAGAASKIDSIVH